ncbi:MAG: FecR domain-containing protein [Candidatus Binataceae bacterium]|nr:FecR domain-containing protein [Candidatus Binataceae bacterium]
MLARSSNPHAFRHALYLVAAAMLFCASQAFAQVAAGTATAVSGQVQLQRSAATTALTTGTAIMVGDRITTGAASSATITLTDQSQLEIHDSSTITIDQHLVGPSGRLNTRVGLVSGLLRSFVHVTSSGAPNFQVNTPNAIAAARGTTYDTAFHPGQKRSQYPNCGDFTDVSVSDGVVEVRSTRNPGASPVEIKAGYTTSVPCALPPLAPAASGTTSGGLGGFTGVNPGMGAAPPPPPPPPLPPIPSGGGFPG